MQMEGKSRSANFLNYMPKYEWIFGLILFAQLSITVVSLFSYICAPFLCSASFHGGFLFFPYSQDLLY